jgi:NAD(P)-dependent dehydrogenase (short-subunit alcohol dehydrogenase family)
VVVVNYTSSRSGADAVVRRITQKEGNALAVQADVSKAEDIQRLFAETKKAFGKLDIVVNCTKAAVNAITKSLAKELGPRKIRVNAVNPGMVESEGTHTAGILESEFRKNTEAQTPLGRIGQPQDIAPAVVFFASPESACTTGETLYISGGIR